MYRDAGNDVAPNPILLPRSFSAVQQTSERLPQTPPAPAPQEHGSQETVSQAARQDSQEPPTSIRPYERVVTLLAIRPLVCRRSSRGHDRS
jgi:hypothetical protein